MQVKLNWLSLGRRSNHELKIKIDGKKLVPSKFVKYLGVLIDCHIKWNFHIVELKTKLSRAVGMLSKIRHYVRLETLINIYYGIFSSLMRYGSQIWGQHNSAVKKIQIAQSKALWILLHFVPHIHHYFENVIY